MSFDITSTLKAVQSHLSKNGYIRGGVLIGEPKSPPTGPVAAAVFMSEVTVAQLTLGTTIERHTVIVRLYENMLSDPTESIELTLATVVSKIMSDLAGEYDLGATIRNVDIGGQHGAPLSARWGYLDVGGTMFRMADISVGLIIDDSATLAA